MHIVGGRKEEEVGLEAFIELYNAQREPVL